MPPVVGRYYHNSAYVGCRTARPDNRHKWVEQPKARDWDRTDWIAAHWIIISKWKGLFTGRLPTVIWCNRYLKTDHNSLWRMELFDNFSSFIIKKRLTTSTERESYALLYVCLFFCLFLCLFVYVLPILQKNGHRHFYVFIKSLVWHKKQSETFSGVTFFPWRQNPFVCVCVCVCVRVCMEGVKLSLSKITEMDVGILMFSFRIGWPWY